jgi:UDP-N-acetylmuramate: L-alanyl-gamma-D-glutamyl-meso-diaminopimelate ligase
MVPMRTSWPSSLDNAGNAYEATRDTIAGMSVTAAAIDAAISATAPALATRAMVTRREAMALELSTALSCSLLALGRPRDNVAPVRIHCIGVAGTGMGALAGLLASAGHEVTGSDVAFDPPIGPELAGWGILCLVGFDAAHLDPAPDLVVVGNVCRKDNPEARAAIDRGFAVTTMPHALADLALKGCSPLVVAGTHGKTTTSAMAAWLLESAGLGPGFFIGGLPKNFGTGFRFPKQGASPRAGGSASSRAVPFVVEGDEYDTAFFEKTPKLWHYRAEVAIVTSIEHDHVDIYPDEASYEAAFRGFFERLPESGLCVAAASDARVVRLVRQSARSRVRWFALDGDETHGISPEWVGAPRAIVNGVQTFDLYVDGVSRGRLGIGVPGAHNVRNALAAVAAVVEGYACGLPEVTRALASFTGVRRRQDLVGEARGVRVYDDFAHHPTAVFETLRALKAKHPEGTLWAVFEPRSATACRALHQHAYATAFGSAGRVVFAPLGRTNVPEAERLDLDALVADLVAQGQRAQASASVDAIIEIVAREARPGDTIALLSNGAFGGIHQRLLGALGR